MSGETGGIVEAVGGNNVVIPVLDDGCSLMVQEYTAKPRAIWKTVSPVPATPEEAEAKVQKLAQDGLLRGGNGYYKHTFSEATVDTIKCLPDCELRTLLEAAGRKRELEAHAKGYDAIISQTSEKLRAKAVKTFEKDFYMAQDQAEAIADGMGSIWSKALKADKESLLEAGLSEFNAVTLRVKKKQKLIPGSESGDDSGDSGGEVEEEEEGEEEATGDLSGGEA